MHGLTMKIIWILIVNCPIRAFLISKYIFYCNNQINSSFPVEIDF